MEKFIRASLASFALLQDIRSYFKVSATRQRWLDASRKSYTITYPRNTSESGVQDFLRHISSDLIPNMGDGGAVPTLVAEVRWTDKGVRHVLRVTPQDEDHVLSQLEAHLGGVTFDIVDTPAEALAISPVFAVDVLMSPTDRTLRIDSARALAVSILHSASTIAEGEAVVYQVILSHTTNVKMPTDGKKAKQPAWELLVLGKKDAGNDEIRDKKQKVVEQNFNVTLRIAAQAASEARGRQLVGGVLRSIRSAESNHVKFSGRILTRDVTDTINHALTPKHKTAQLTVSELSALMAPPIGDPAVPGLIQGAARRIAATEAVARDGRLLGHSNINDRGRPVALGYDFVDRNTICIGGIGSGKSVMMANNAFDDINQGMGVIVIDASGSDSAQSLYSRVHDYIPHHRIDDVIDIHVRNNADFPIAFDLFKQGRGLGAIDQITGVFTALYPDIATGVSVRELLYHGLWTLIEADLNIVDLDPLLRPKTSELLWANKVIDSVKNPELKDFWERMRSTGFGAKEPAKRDRWDRYTDPLYRRLWQLVGRPEIRHMIGQSVQEGEGLNWQKALQENKIVLISLSGLPEETAQLMGSLLLDSLWSTAQGMTPEKPNALYMDEFQVSSGIREGLADLLARGRKHKLPVTLGTQYVHGLPKDIQSAVMNNVQTRIIYPLTSADEAHAWSRNMASDKLTDYDFQSGRRFEPIVQLPTDLGSQIVTIKALQERDKTGQGYAAAQRSKAKYGTPVEQVRKEIVARRGGAEPKVKVDVPQGSISLDLVE